GMVLAGGLEVTPVLESEPQRIDPPATTVGGLPNFADLAEQVSPAVASIATVRIEEAPSRRGAPMDPFEWFFGPRRMPQEDGQPRERRQDSGGSGFLVDASGLVVTNNHVIEGATSVTVHLGDE